MGRATAEKIRKKEEEEKKITSALLGGTRREKQQKYLHIPELIELAKVNYNREKLLRLPDKYVPKSRNHERQLIDFIKHCFVKYYVPSFMFDAFKHYDANHVSWFICIAQGGSLYREFFKSYFEGRMTQKDTFNFINNFNNNLSIKQNLLFAKAVSLGGKNFANNIVGSRFYILANVNDYWEDVLRFIFVNKDNVSNKDLSDLMDFFSNKQRERYSLKGRTLNSVIKQSDDWHLDVQRQKCDKDEWEGLPIEDWEFLDSEKLNGKYIDVVWKIKQLTSSKALRKEGNEMKHCVSSYSYRCKEGHCSIFHLEKVSELDTESALTIEVDNKSKRILQVRGKYNRLPTAYENQIISKWKTHLQG